METLASNRNLFVELDEESERIQKLEEELAQLKRLHKEHLDRVNEMASFNMDEGYEDRLFKYIFGNPANKEWALSLHNALTGAHGTDTRMIKVDAIGETVYIRMKDETCLLASFDMHLLGLKGMPDDDMPRRYIVYGGKMYAKYDDGPQERAGYSKKIHLPTPMCVCLCNGEDEEEKQELTLDAGGFGVKVRMFNVNAPGNKEIVETCKPLGEYIWLLTEIRRYQADGKQIGEAASLALEAMPDDFVVKGYLHANRQAVQDMLVAEYEKKIELEWIMEEYAKACALKDKNNQE